MAESQGSKLCSWGKKQKKLVILYLSVVRGKKLGQDLQQLYPECCYGS